MYNKMSFLRIVQAYTERVDVYINGLPSFLRLLKGETSAYQDIIGPECSISVYENGELSKSTTMCIKGMFSTIVIAKDFHLYKDRRNDKTVGMARLRFLHFDDDIGDLTITVNGTTIGTHSYAMIPKYYRFKLGKHVWDIVIDNQNGFRRVFTISPTNQSSNTILVIDEEIHTLNDTPGFINTFAPNFKLGDFTRKWYYVAGIGLPFHSDFIPCTVTMTNLYENVKIDFLGTDDTHIIGKLESLYHNYPTVLRFTFPNMEKYLKKNGINLIVHEYIHNRYALVGNTNSSILLFLSATPIMPTDLYTYLFYKSKNLGYPIDLLYIRAGSVLIYQ